MESTPSVNENTENVAKQEESVDGQNSSPDQSPLNVDGQEEAADGGEGADPSQAKKKKKRNRKKKNKDKQDDDGGDEAGKVEEQKQSEAGAGKASSAEPMDDLSEALRELKIDRSAPDYKVEAAAKFTAISEDMKVPHLRRARFKHLAALLGKHKYWEGEAIVQPGEAGIKQGMIKHFKKEDVPQEPSKLPDGFEWAPFDVDNDDHVEELRAFLEKHYVEDEHGAFRLKYSAEKIRWVLSPPNVPKECHVTVRSTANGSLLACAMGMLKTYTFQGQKVKVLEGNFLAVHTKVRSKRLAQVVLAELLRKKRLQGIQHGIYTSNHSHPTPFVTCHFMQRYLNGEKLVLSKFTRCPATMSLQDFDKKLRLPKRESVKIQGAVRPMLKKDVPAVYKLFKDQQSKYRMHHRLSQEEVLHYLLPRDDVVWTWVIENPVDGKNVVTDFFSMYRITQSCVDPEAVKLGCTAVHIACLYFYGLTVNSIREIGLLACHLAKDDLAADSFSVEQVMDNTSEIFIDDLQFVWGDGPLYHYLVNWSIGNEKVGPHDIGVVLN